MSVPIIWQIRRVDDPLHRPLRDVRRTTLHRPTWGCTLSTSALLHTTGIYRQVCAVSIDATY